MTQFEVVCLGPRNALVRFITPKPKHTSACFANGELRTGAVATGSHSTLGCGLSETFLGRYRSGPTSEMSIDRVVVMLYFVAIRKRLMDPKPSALDLSSLIR